MKFRNILIPTDFNEAATHALPFAKMVAEKSGAGIRLAHVRFSLSEQKPAQTTPDKEVDAPAKTTGDVLTGRTQHVTTLTDTGVTVNFDYKQGLPSVELIKMTAEEDIDLMIIGSKGDYDIIDKWIGTVSTDVAMEGKCPVIIVPLKARLKPVKKILYATDAAGVNYESLATIMEFAKTMDAAIHFIHISERHAENKKKLNADYLEYITDSEFETVPFEINTVHAAGIRQGLEKYIQRRKMDMLVLVTRQRAGLDAFFHGSFTHKSLFHPWKVPVMVLHA